MIMPGPEPTAGEKTEWLELSDDKQILCFAFAFLSGTAKIPSSRKDFFGLTNGEGNHGEDVKEYYFYLDSTPTHSYMKYLYKYPQSAFPYDNLVATPQSLQGSP